MAAIRINPRMEFLFIILSFDLGGQRYSELFKGRR